MRFASKRELVESIEREHEKLLQLAGSLPLSDWEERGVWGDGWTVKDLFAHLTEWEQMFLRWFREGRAGGRPELPAPGYKWNQTPELNRSIWRKHKERPLPRVRSDFEDSYLEISALAHELSEEDLLQPGRFAWTGKNPLTTYLAANTCSHYRTASKILKRWLSNRPAQS